MANVYINGKRIVPAPFYSISHDINRTAGGNILSCNYTISLTGTILPDRGYPTSTGGLISSTADGLDLIETGIVTSNQRFQSLLNKQAALKELVLLEGTGYNSNKTVQIINTTGGSNGQTDDKIEFNFLASNIEFDPSTTTVKSDYTITFNANDVRLNNRSINPASGTIQDYNLRSASDTMNIEWAVDRDDTVKVVRSVKAQSYKSFDADVQANINASSGWQFAKAWVKAQFPNDPRAAPTAAINGVPIVSLPANYGYVGAIVTEDLDRYGGEYGMNVTWTYAPLNAGDSAYAADEYTISKNTNRVGNKVTYKVAGTIKGFKDTQYKATPYDAAKTYYLTALTVNALKTRIANTFSVSSASIQGPTIEVTNHNNFNGTISYDYEFYHKLANLPPCFYDFDINVTKNENERLIAEVAVPGRTTGPVIQDITTFQSKKRSVSANFILAESGANFGIMNGLKATGVSFLQSLLAVPTGSDNSDFWLTSFNHNLDIVAGRYSMNFSYTEKW